MKKLNVLLIAFLATICLQLQAQEGRFMQEVFSDVTVTSDVVYGVNATVLLLPTVGEAIPQPLTMDVYEPVGDERTERPLVLVFHTGNFLPVPQNAQILGTKTDSSVVEICTRLAKYGYTAAAVTYRQGWNPLAETQPTRALGLIQAAYRGVQDGRTAIRFFKRNYVEAGNQFAVDTSRITAWGVGTGGYISNAMVGLDDYTEILTTTNGVAKFFIDADGDGVVETPMVLESVHGDIEGKEFAFGIPAFGFPEGDTTNYPNHVEYSSDFQLGVNIGGDLADISFLDERSPPTITFQSANDFFAPYEDAVLIVPTTGDPIVRVQGGRLIAEVQNELGNNDVFINANIDDEFTAQARANSAIAGHDYFEGLYPIVNPPNANGLDEGVPIDWWDPNALSPPVEGFPDGLPWNVLPHPTDPTGMLSFHAQGLLTNANMSAEQGRTYLDTVFGYFAPRAFAALDLAAYTSVEEVKASEVELVITPNPASDQAIIRTALDQPILDIEIYDLSGRLMQSAYGVDNNYYFIHRQNMPSGIYIAKMRFEDGILAEKIMFK